MSKDAKTAHRKSHYMSKILPTSNGYYIILDDEDYERASGHTWRTDIQDGYIQRVSSRINKKLVSMHSFILGDKDGHFIDHINRCVFDNRKINLRHATPAESCRNRGKPKIKSTSKYKGVHFDKIGRRWVVTLTKNINGKRAKVFNKYFKCELTAARAYNEAAKIHYGEFACLNEID